MCRNTAKMVSDMKPKLDELGINIVGVVNSSVGLEEFIDKGYFTGPIFIDETLELFSQCAPTMGVGAMAHAMTLGAFYLPSLIKKGIEGNMVAPPNTTKYLDAIVVIAKGGSVVYLHGYERVTDYPNWEIVLQKCVEASKL